MAEDRLSEERLKAIRRFMGEPEPQPEPTALPVRSTQHRQSMQDQLATSWKRVRTAWDELAPLVATHGAAPGRRLRSLRVPRVPAGVVRLLRRRLYPRWSVASIVLGVVIGVFVTRV